MSLIRYAFQCRNPDGSLAWEREIGNLTPDEGASYLVDAAIFGETQVSDWFVGIIGNTYNASTASKASDIPTLLQEFSAYTLGTRPQWTPNKEGVTASDAAAPITLTVTPGTPDTNIYGGFVGSNSVKNTGAGVLLSITRWASPEVVRGGQTLQITSVFDPRNPL